MTASEIVRAVGRRAKMHRFSGWPAENAHDGLIRTGESVAGRLPGIRSRNRTVYGYATLEWITNRPPYIGLTPRYDGPHVIFEREFPFDYQDGSMPDVVIATDIAACAVGDDRRREAALRAVTHFHREWIRSL